MTDINETAATTTAGNNHTAATQATTPRNTSTQIAKSNHDVTSEPINIDIVIRIPEENELSAQPSSLAKLDESNKKTMALTTSSLTQLRRVADNIQSGT